MSGIGEPILELKNISASYDAISVLHDVNITVRRGEVMALLGPNGAGKSTVLKIASALMRPTQGSVHIAGHDLTGAAASELARLGVCTIPEGRGIFPNLTVRENLEMAARKGLSVSVIQERAFPNLG